MSNNDNKDSDDSFGCSFRLLICAFASFMLLYKPIGSIDLSIMFGNVKHLYQYPILMLALLMQVLGTSFAFFLFSAVLSWIIQLFQIGEKASFIVSVVIVCILFYLFIHSTGASSEYDYVDHMMDRVR